MSLRHVMEAVTTRTAVTIACSMCQRPWQRPQGMTERRCPACSARRGVHGRSPGEQLAFDVTRYRLAIEEATACLQAGQTQAALQVLQAVEAPGRGVQIGGIIGPGRAQGSPGIMPAASPTLSPVPAPAPEPVSEPVSAVDDDDPIALVQNLALGAYRVEPKRGARDRRRRP